MTTPIDGPLLRAVIDRARRAIAEGDNQALRVCEILTFDTLAEKPIMSDLERLEGLSLLGLSAQLNPR